jgi:predicted GNAT family acetyltransferase
MDINTLEVKHNPEAKRFEVQLGEQLAMVEYMIAGNNMIFTHTEVPREYEGQGIANRMVKFALDYAVNAGRKIQPLCPIVKLYVERHPEYQAHSWGY